MHMCFNSLVKSCHLKEGRRMANVDLSNLSHDIVISHIVGFELAVIDSWHACCRQDHQLYYNIVGSREYFREDGTLIFTACPDDLVLCPYGSSYRCVAIPGEKNLGILLKFDLRDSDGRPVDLGGEVQIVARDHEGFYLEKLRAVLKQCLRGGFALLKAKSLLYDLLLTLTNDQMTAPADPLLRSLLPAVRYMQNHLQQGCCIDALAELCFMSRSTFYRRFRACFHTSPAEWHMRLRIEKSEELLRSGMYTAERVSAQMGFCDAAHFCRTFYRITGKYAREYRPRAYRT